MQQLKFTYHRNHSISCVAFFLSTFGMVSQKWIMLILTMMCSLEAI